MIVDFLNSAGGVHHRTRKPLAWHARRAPLTALVAHFWWCLLVLAHDQQSVLATIVTPILDDLDVVLLLLLGELLAEFCLLRLEVETLTANRHVTLPTANAHLIAVLDRAEGKAGLTETNTANCVQLLHLFALGNKVQHVEEGLAVGGSTQG